MEKRTIEECSQRLLVDVCMMLNDALNVCLCSSCSNYCWIAVWYVGLWFIIYRICDLDESLCKLLFQIKVLYFSFPMSHAFGSRFELMHLQGLVVSTYPLGIHQNVPEVMYSGQKR